MPGDFDFTVMTSDNATPATSNILTVGTTPPTLSAASYVLGSNTSYLLSGATWTTLSQTFHRFGAYGQGDFRYKHFLVRRAERLFGHLHASQRRSHARPRSTP